MNQNQPEKIKELKQQKRKLISRKNVLKKMINDIRKEKKELQKQLEEQKKMWKIALEESQIVEKQLSELSQKIKDKKTKGKRGFRMSGLSINIKEKLNKNLIEFYNLESLDNITRVIMMKQLFQYIESHDLYTENDRRYIDINKDVDELLNAYQINKDELDDNIRVQKFRFYLEQNIDKTKK